MMDLILELACIDLAIGVFDARESGWRFGVPMEVVEKWYLNPVVANGTWVGEGGESMTGTGDQAALS